jgi:hypothetical protein
VFVVSSGLMHWRAPSSRPAQGTPLASRFDSGVVGCGAAGWAEPLPAAIRAAQDAAAVSRLRNFMAIS